MKIRRIIIAGLGLIGGSLAKAFRRTNSGFEIIGVEKDKDSRDLALEDGTVNRAYETVEDAASAITDSQVVFLCTPVSGIPGLLKALGDIARPGTILTDVGSVKVRIMEEAARILPKDICFIGGHPMAGAEQSGYPASRAHLFENAYYVLTPPPGTPEEIRKSLELLIASTGALPLILDPLTHDRKVGSVSHLPHIIAAALVNTVREADGPDRAALKLAAGGFKDITRIASSDPEMWRDICLSNREQLMPLLAGVIRHLSRFGRALESNEAPEIEAFYRDAKAFRDRLPSLDSLYLLPCYEVYVDVEDKPGIIGQVTTLLGNHNVNIKNIRIINSREEEPGCLVLSLTDPEAQDKALALLTREGCRAYKR
mgnify:FL=1